MGPLPEVHVLLRNISQQLLDIPTFRRLALFQQHRGVAKYLSPRTLGQVQKNHVIQKTCDSTAKFLVLEHQSKVRLA